VPLAAALVAGWLLGRRTLRTSAVSWAGLLGPAALAGPVAGALLGLASLASSGPLGDGRLAHVGPHAGWVALTAALVVGIGACLAAAATKMFLGVRRSHG